MGRKIGRKNIYNNVCNITSLGESRSPVVPEGSLEHATRERATMQAGVRPRTVDGQLFWLFPSSGSQERDALSQIQATPLIVAVGLTACGFKEGNKKRRAVWRRSSSSCSAPHLRLRSHWNPWVCLRAREPGFYGRSFPYLIDDTCGSLPWCQRAKIPFLQNNILTSSYRPCIMKLHWYLIYLNTV